jgi:hypothetical protein
MRNLSLMMLGFMAVALFTSATAQETNKKQARAIAHVRKGENGYQSLARSRARLRAKPFLSQEAIRSARQPSASMPVTTGQAPPVQPSLKTALPSYSGTAQTPDRTATDRGSLESSDITGVAATADLTRSARTDRIIGRENYS